LELALLPDSARALAEITALAARSDNGSTTTSSPKEITS
jgi:hypothetical protein